MKIKLLPKSSKKKDKKKFDATCNITILFTTICNTSTKTILFAILSLTHNKYWNISILKNKYCNISQGFSIILLQYSGIETTSVNHNNNENLSIVIKLGKKF